MFDILKFLDDAPIKLTSGVGEPATGGCWMAALSVYENSNWSDHPDCVCRVVRVLCIAINDSISSNEKRGELLSGVLLEPVDTHTHDPAIQQERALFAADAAVRTIIPAMFRSHGILLDSAKSLESLPQLTNAVSAAAMFNKLTQVIIRTQAIGARNLANHLQANEAATSAKAVVDLLLARRIQKPIDHHIKEAMLSAERAIYRVIRGLASPAADWAEGVAASASNVLWDAPQALRPTGCDGRSHRDAFIKDTIIPLIPELCKIGSKVPVEPSYDERAFRKAVQCGDPPVTA